MSVPELERESAYLRMCRAALGQMRADVLNTETPQVKSEDYDEIWNNTVYRLARARRSQDLVDLPDVPLFFGRLDYEPGVLFEVGNADPDGTDRAYIGRRHVRDETGRPLVVDWRAPVSAPFYQATRQDPQRVRLRRRYGFSDTAELTAYEDEHLDVAGAAPPSGALLTAEIERPRTGPMRDIVATIQPEQDSLVRAPLQPSLCVQGAPGTGKTAVGLHRLAYLLYTEAERLGAGVAVVGPNRSFLAYIRHVLPALGEVAVRQTTIEELVGRAPTAVDRVEAARVKGDARMATVLSRALWHHLQPAADDLVYVRGGSRYRVAASRISAIVAELRGTTRYAAGREALAQRVAHLVLLQMESRGATPDDRDQNTVARSKPVQQVRNQVWPKLTPEQVLFRLLSDRAFLAEVADGQLTEEEQAAISWTRPYRSAKSAKWSPADAVLLDELADLVDRTPSLSHVMVDEAQDLSPMQCRALGRRCVGGSLTVLGDIAQGTSPWAVDDWSTLLTLLGKPDARLAMLDRGFRVPAEIIDFAAALLPTIAPGVPAPTSLRRAPGALRVLAVAADDLPATVAQVCRGRLSEPGATGVIAADADIVALHDHLRSVGIDVSLLGQDEAAMESGRLVCVPASLAKGLEFDAVVVAEPSRIVAAEPRGRQRLYVALTRAVTSLHVVHAEPLPAPLGDGASPSVAVTRPTGCVPSVP